MLAVYSVGLDAQSLQIVIVGTRSTPGCTRRGWLEKPTRRLFYSDADTEGFINRDTIRCQLRSSVLVKKVDIRLCFNEIIEAELAGLPLLEQRQALAKSQERELPCRFPAPYRNQRYPANPQLARTAFSRSPASESRCA